MVDTLSVAAVSSAALTAVAPGGPGCSGSRGVWTAVARGGPGLQWLQGGLACSGSRGAWAAVAPGGLGLQWLLAWQLVPECMAASAGMAAGGRMAWQLGPDLHGSWCQNGMAAGCDVGAPYVADMTVELPMSTGSKTFAGIKIKKPILC